jgi:hypothetical protein
MLTVILASAVLGTLIVQGSSGEEFAKIYGRRLSSVLVGFSLHDIFHSLWFGGLLVLLSISLVLAVIKRKMWKLPKWGYLLSHLGVVLILIGGFVGSLFGFKGFMDLHEGRAAKGAVKTEGGVRTDYVHPLGFSMQLLDFEIEMYEPEYRLYEYERAGESYRAVKSYGLDECGDWVSLTGDFDFRVKEAYPDFRMRSELREAVADEGIPALQIDLQGMGIKDAVLFSRGLDLEATRLSPDGVPVRFLWESPDQESLERYRESRPEVHTVIFEKHGCCPREELAVEPGGKYLLASGKYSLRVLDYQPDFIYDTKARKPSTRSERPNNPALLVAVGSTNPGHEEERWLFAKMPEFGRQHGRQEDWVDLEYRYAPARVPAAEELIIVGKTSELWKLGHGEIENRASLPPESEGIPELSAAGFKIYESAREVQVHGTRSKEWKNPVVEIELRHNGSVQSILLPAAHSEPLRLPDGRTVVAFEQKPDEVKAYRSRLSVLEDGDKVLEKTIAVNDPLSYKGYKFYQSNYRKEDPTYSGVLVVRDPGLILVWTGFVMICAGVIFAFYARPRILERRSGHVN